VLAAVTEKLTLGLALRVSLTAVLPQRGAPMTKKLGGRLHGEIGALLGLAA